MLLSATLIVRNEALHLPGCLASIADVVDEVIVVDTGSSDTTLEIARAAGATLVSRPWDDSFAPARNAALDLAAGQWILYIDADERLAGAAGLRDALAATDAVAGLVRFRPGRGYTQYREYRLFRNRPDIRFRGIIHETIVPDITRLEATEGVAVVDVPAEIDHLGYEGDQTAKHRRNLPLLERQLSDDPERLYLWFHLGMVLDGLGDADAAAAAWARGVAVARRQPEPGAYAVLAYANLVLVRLRQGSDAADFGAELGEHFPDDPFAAWARARELMGRRRWDEAVPLLQGLAATDATAVVHPVLAHDRRIFGELASHGLGVCYFHLGDDGAAEWWFGRALEAAPDVDEYRRKRDLCAARAAGAGRVPGTAPAGR